MLLWLWHRLAAGALIQPLAWELPYAAGVALKSKKTKNKKQKQKQNKKQNPKNPKKQNKKPHAPKPGQNNAICSNMDKARDSHTKRSQKEKDKYHVILLTGGI